MMEKNIKKYSDCVWYCYGQYCSKDYNKEKKEYGYSDLTEHRCYKRCEKYRKRNLLNTIIKKIFF